MLAARVQLSPSAYLTPASGSARLTVAQLRGLDRQRPRSAVFITLSMQYAYFTTMIRCKL